MRRERLPDEGYRALLKLGMPPTDPADAAVWNYIILQHAHPVAERVVDLYQSDFEREQLQAWIVAGADDERINRDLRIPIAVLQTFRRLCCNVANFRDRLEMLRWVNQYGGTRQGKLLLEKAVHFHGVEALAHLHGLPSNLDPSEVHKQTMREAYFRGISTARATRLGTPEAVAANAALKTAAASALALGGGDDASLTDVIAKLKLKFREDTLAADAAVPREEILH